MSRLQHGSATVGVLVFLVGIGLVGLLSNLPTICSLPSRGGTQPRQGCGNRHQLYNLFQVVVKVILLIVMAAIGSMVANRGIKLYASPRKGVAKPKAEKPKEKAAKTDA
ncbi:MAG: hypothetical protein R2688_01240 [Fimbriimonadaceae bacterium]